MEIVLSIKSRTDGSVREEKREIGSGLAMGRGAEHGLLLDGPDLSREHVLLSEDGADIYVTDTSVNGTWLNGTRLRKSVKTPVRPGDSIEVPGYVLTFRPAEEAQTSTEAPEALPQRTLVPENNLRVVPRPTFPGMVLDPVLRFTGSFTFLEKLLVFVALGGLVLVYTYVNS